MHQTCACGAFRRLHAPYKTGDPSLASGTPNRPVDVEAGLLIAAFDSAIPPAMIEVEFDSPRSDKTITVHRHWRLKAVASGTRPRQHFLISCEIRCCRMVWGKANDCLDCLTLMVDSIPYGKGACGTSSLTVPSPEESVTWLF